MVFEFDNNFSGPSQPGNVVVAINAQNTSQQIAGIIANAIQGTGLGLSPTVLAGAQISLGILQTSQVALRTSPLTLTRGVVTDGESFTISNGTRSVTFEFENVDSGNASLLVAHRFCSARTVRRTPSLSR